MKKTKVLNLLGSVKAEFRKVLTLGKKMFIAGQTNADLSEAFKQLGFQTYLTMKKNAADQTIQNVHNPQPQNDQVKELLSIIAQLERAMYQHEEEIFSIKHRT